MNYISNFKVEAVQLDYLGFASAPNWLMEAVKNDEVMLNIDSKEENKTYAVIPGDRLSLKHRVNPGDYILRFEDGSLAICRQELFEKYFKPERYCNTRGV